MATRDDVERLKQLFSEAAAEGIRGAHDAAFRTFELAGEGIGNLRAVERLNLDQRDVQPVHELGSERTHLVPGRSVVEGTARAARFADIMRDAQQAMTREHIVPFRILPVAASEAETQEMRDRMMREINTAMSVSPSLITMPSTTLSGERTWQTEILGDFRPEDAPEDVQRRHIRELEDEVQRLRQQAMERQMADVRRVNPYDRTQPLSDAELRAYEALRAGGGSIEADFVRSMLDMGDREEYVAERPRPPAPEPEPLSKDFRPGRSLELD